MAETVEMWADALDQLSPLRRMALWYAVVEGEALPEFAERMDRGELAAIDLVQSSLTCLGSVLVSMQADGSVDGLAARLATTSSVDLSASEHRQLRTRIAEAVQGDALSAAALLRKRPKRTWFAVLKAVPVTESTTPTSRRGAVLVAAAAAVVVAGVGGVAMLGRSDDGTAAVAAEAKPAPVSAYDPEISVTENFLAPGAEPSPSAQAVAGSTTLTPLPALAPSSSISVAPAPSASPTKKPTGSVPSTPSEPDDSPIAVSVNPDKGQVTVVLNLGFGDPITITTPPIVAH